jgi:hypothetical protein
MRIRSQMTRRRWIIAGLVLLAVGAAAGSTIAVASSGSGAPSTGFTIRQGTPVPSQLITDRERTALTASGATDQLYLLGQKGDHAYYRALGADGQACYALGNDTAFLEVGCLHSDSEMPTPLFDISRVVVGPSSGSVLRLDSVEGIAADQVSTVAIERADGSLVTAPVSENSYRFADDAIPSDSVAIEALGANGAVLQRKSLR